MQGHRYLSLLLLSILCYVVNSVYIFDVYRMLQYEKGTIPFGSQRSTLSSLAITYHKGIEGDLNNLLSRYIVIIPAEEMTIEIMDKLIERNPDGIVILLPQQDDNTLITNWLDIEKNLLQTKIPSAVYFAFRGSSVDKLYEELSRDETFTTPSSFIGADSYRLEVPHPEAAPMKEYKLFNVQGWLAGTALDVPGEGITTIAIVAYYDTSAIAPGLAYGVDSNGSGVVILLELARLFSKLYHSPKTQGRYNLLFLLTGGGRLNFAGTKAWLDKTDTNFMETIDFALCLDTIGTNRALNLHVSRSTKDTKAAKIYDAFSAVANHMGIPFNVTHKKINIGSTEIPWQHEQFSRKRILASTLSGESEPSPSLSRTNIFDTRIDNDILKTNLVFVAESLSRIIYDLDYTKNLSIFSEDLAVSDMHVSSWIQTLSRIPRMMPYLTHRHEKDKNPNNTFISGLEKELNRYLVDVSHKTIVLTPDESGLLFYDKITTQMSAYRGKPVSFDIFLTICIMIYCFTLHTILKGPTNTWLQIKQIFTTSKKRR